MFTDTRAPKSPPITTSLLRCVLQPHTIQTALILPLKTHVKVGFLLWIVKKKRNGKKKRKTTPNRQKPLPSFSPNKLQTSSRCRHIWLELWFTQTQKGHSNSSLHTKGWQKFEGHIKHGTALLEKNSTFFFLVSLHWWSNKFANTDAHKHTYTHNAWDKQHTRSQGLFTHANVLQRTHNRRAKQSQESSAFTLPAFRRRKKKLSNVNGCFTAIKCYYVWRNKWGELWKYWYKLNFVKKKNEPGKEGESLEGEGGIEFLIGKRCLVLWSRKTEKERQ